MPELPEVETVRRTLEHLVLGEKIVDVDVFYPKIIHTDFDLFTKRIINQTIHRIDRMGKHLILILDTDALIIHLRMEGRFFVKKNQEPISKHEHVIFHLSSNRELRYHDVRKFGTMHLIRLDQYLNVSPLSQLGKEPDDLLYTSFYGNIHKKNTEIKAVMLDQHVVSGLGNIYVDETLFRAGVHPERKASSININEAKCLLDEARLVLKEAVLQGGTTIRTFQPMDGVHGRFQNELLVHTKAGKPCTVCGTEIIKIKVKGRGTYVCPKCQK